MSDLKTIDLVHVQAGDRWMRGWDGMIRWVILEQLTKFTYNLGTDGEDGMIRWVICIFSVKTIGQVHIHSGDGWRGWDGMIRWVILRKIDEVHVHSGDDWRRWDGMTQMRDIKTIDQLNVRSEGMERMGQDDQMRDHKTIEKVHLLPREGWRGWDGMMGWEILKQLTKFKY